MQKILKLNALILFLVVFSCSIDQDEQIDREVGADVIEMETIANKTSGGSCSSVVNFDNLVVETSWISNKTGDRDEFGACGVDGESWMDRYNDNRVMLKCRSGDGHRTELKERGGDEASLNQYKRIIFKAKYTNIPENGVTIAQIHNRDNNIKRPWIRVYIDDDRYVKIKETETNPTSSSSSYSTFKGPKYTSGKEMEIRVWTGLNGQSKAKVRVVTGGVTYNKTLWPSGDWSSHSNDYYLKAGVYTEGNNKNAVVKYSSFSIIH